MYVSVRLVLRYSVECVFRALSDRSGYEHEVKAGTRVLEPALHCLQHVQLNSKYL